LEDEVIAEIIAQLKQEVSERTETPIENIDPTVHLADLGIDSLQALQLLVMLERTYGVQLGEDDLKHFTSLESVATLVSRRMEAAQAA
jgi:acyl carrier protein